MAGKWFPPKVDLAEIERKEAKKLNKMAEHVIGRIDAVREAGIDYDNFAISFEPVIRKATMVEFMKELLGVLEGMSIASNYDFSCYFYSDSPHLTTIEYLDYIVRKSIPSKDSRVFSIEIKKKPKKQQP